ncbi:hypothetical protein F1559_001211 [Cyanidiococcus yangmingshanensis]|uniref:tRNA/rRNA methyltransferase SpoU type domain-containing protein n=1 Tax=Cyanidiococcus yangmingshanensis TaxID=2690220 RepID=A0A7J7IL86_9RHOD|nr:hypothetical protein F1559_001211 [Cyanidiococcus yangmingshanensis]
MGRPAVGFLQGTTTSALRWRLFSRTSTPARINGRCLVATYGPGVTCGPLRHASTGEPLLNIVLYAPSIHWNTGNAARTAVGFQARLHLIEPLGFSLSDRHLKRAGLDYWPHVDLRVWPSWSVFWEKGIPTLGHVFFFTKFAARSLVNVDLVDSSANADLLNTKITLIFGNEIHGFENIPPEDIPLERTVAIPMVCPSESGIRSYNLSTSVGIVLWEAYRQVHVALRNVRGDSAQELSSRQATQQSNASMTSSEAFFNGSMAKPWSIHGELG